MINISAKIKSEKVVDFLKGYHPSTPVTYKIATSLLGGLDKSTLNELAMVVEDDFIRYRIRKMLGTPGKSQRNNPVGKLLRLYQDKKSGKVTTSRDELFRRFPYLDTSWQKRIVEAFFNGSESDIEKMSRYLIRNWDEMHAVTVKTAWSGNRENAFLSTLVIRYMDLAFVMEHIEELKVYGGPVLASRLCQVGEMPKVEDWPLPDYLAILYKAGRSVEEKEAIGLMMAYLVSAAYKDLEVGRVPDYTIKSDIKHPSLIYLEGVRLVVYSLGRMGLVQALSEFEAIDDDVCTALNREVMQQVLSEESISREEKITAIWKEFCTRVVSSYSKPGQMPVMVKHNTDLLPCINHGTVQLLEPELDTNDIDF